MIKDLITSNRYKDIRLILVFTTLLTILLWIKDSLEISCLLALIQNVFLVLIITIIIINRMNLNNKILQIKNGIIISGSIGALYATMMFLVEDTKYYFFGGRLQVAKDLGLPFIPLSNDLLITELISEFWIWSTLVIVSLSCGFIAGVISQVKIKDK